MNWKPFATAHELEMIEAVERDLKNAKDRFTYVRRLVYDRCRQRKRKAND